MTIYRGFGSVLMGFWLQTAVFAASDRSTLASTSLGGWPNVLEPSFHETHYEGLAAHLSADAVVYYPNSPGFTNATTRWSVGYNPNPSVVVVPATADDVAAATVDSSSDLWWGLLGAGHNFAIVTSVEYKIHDIDYHDWAYETFIYSGDKVEAVFTSLNNDLLKNGSQLLDVIVYGFFFYDAASNATAVDSKYTSPLLALEPLVATGGSGNYLDVAVWTAQNANSSLCAKGTSIYTRYPIDLPTWNVAAMTEAYSEYVQMMVDEPAFNGSFFIFEQYPMQGVKAVDRASTAVPWRDYNLLLSPTVIYAPGGPELDQKAKAAGEKQRRILREGTGSDEMSAYVNYAFGDETLEEMYGHEPWRQERLAQLKDKYDPHRKFRFYAPIA